MQEMRIEFMQTNIVSDKRHAKTSCDGISARTLRRRHDA